MGLVVFFPATNSPSRSRSSISYRRDRGHREAMRLMRRVVTRRRLLPGVERLVHAYLEIASGSGLAHALAAGIKRSAHRHTASWSAFVAVDRPVPMASATLMRALALDR